MNIITTILKILIGLALIHYIRTNQKDNPIKTKKKIIKENVFFVTTAKQARDTDDNNLRIFLRAPFFYSYALKNNLLNSNFIFFTKDALEKLLKQNIENAPKKYNLNNENIKLENIKTDAEGKVITGQLIPDDWKIFIKDSIDKFIKENSII